MLLNFVLNFQQQWSPSFIIFIALFLFNRLPISWVGNTGPSIWNKFPPSTILVFHPLKPPFWQVLQRNRISAFLATLIHWYIYLNFNGGRRTSFFLYLLRGKGKFTSEPLLHSVCFPYHFHEERNMVMGLVVVGVVAKNKTRERARKDEQDQKKERQKHNKYEKMVHFLLQPVISLKLVV